MHTWKGKHVVVIGGSAGLGLHLARALVAAKAHVSLVARDAERLAQARDELAATGEPPVATYALDVSHAEDVAELYPSLCDQGRALEGMIHCVGKSARGNVTDTTPEEFRTLWELNFLSAVQCTQALLPAIRQSRGHLIYIGSLASKSAPRFLGAYPTSKFPLAAYAQQLRLELGDEGVRVLLACPGPIQRDDAGTRYDDADVPAAARQPGGGAKLKGLNPQKLAHAILRAAGKGRRELVIPSKAKWLFALSQLAPSWGDYVLRKMTGG